MRRVVAEATVLLAIVGAVVALRQRGASPGTSNDPYVGTAPVLVAVAAGLIAARLYPLPLRGLLRLAAPRRSAVGFLGIARAARSRSGVLLPALALVVALAVIALGGTLRAAVTRGQVAASWQQVGADAVIRTTGSQQVVPPAAEKAVASVPGVTHADAIYVVAPHDPLAANLGPGFGSTSIGVVVVNPASYAALVAATPYPAFPARLLAKTGPGPVPVLASPQIAAVLKHGTGHLAFASSADPGPAGRAHRADAGAAGRRPVRHRALLGAGACCGQASRRTSCSPPAPASTSAIWRRPWRERCRAAR